MAHFYGTAKGTRGEASRLGTKSSAMRTVAASWKGAIVVHLNHNEQTGEDMFEVRMESHHGKGDYLVLATGNVGDAMSVHGIQRGDAGRITAEDMLELFKQSCGTNAAEHVIPVGLEGFVNLIGAHVEMTR